MTPAGGRRAITRGVFAIEEPELLPPDPVALDTSFVVEALIATQPLHGVCSPFLTRHQRAASYRAGRGCVRDCAQGTLGRPLATLPNRRTVSPTGRPSAGPHSDPLRQDAREPDAHLDPARRYSNRRHYLHDRLRDRVLRRSARSERHRCRRRSDRDHRHGLRASALVTAHGLHRSLTAPILSQQATALSQTSRPVAVVT
jgi:hypothetical protein